MTIVLRFALGTMTVYLLAACSPKPIETSLERSMRVASLAEREQSRRKTVSSDILVKIALERVTGRPMILLNNSRTLQNSNKY